MAILYTRTQVINAQLRAQVAMYIISQNIENGFYYIGSPVYQTYKTQQYGIYALFNTIGNENPYVTYSSTPTSYEYQFYELVGSLINKTKQFDVYGEFGGALNPNAQIPGTTILINSIKVSKTQANLIDAGGGNWYLPYLDNSNAAIPSAYVPEYISINGVTLNGWTLDDSTVPPRVYGFANADPTQDIELTLI